VLRGLLQHRLLRHRLLLRGSTGRRGVRPTGRWMFVRE
jgi:hypothetical protein